jgi:hypothetical protein
MTVSLVIMGTLMAALALAVSVTLRAAPTASDRIDDSRTTRGLSTWLAQDTTSTPNVVPADPLYGGINTSPTAASDNNDCGGDGQNIVHLSWTETFASTDTTDTYVANYRFVGDGITARVARYTCSRQGTGPFTAPRAQFLTPLLDATAPPVGNFDETANKLEFTLTGQNGETVLIQTSSRNPSDFFP